MDSSSSIEHKELVVGMLNLGDVNSGVDQGGGVNCHDQYPWELVNIRMERGVWSDHYDSPFQEKSHSLIEEKRVQGGEYQVTAYSGTEKDDSSNDQEASAYDAFLAQDSAKKMVFGRRRTESWKHVLLQGSKVPPHNSYRLALKHTPTITSALPSRFKNICTADANLALLVHLAGCHNISRQRLKHAMQDNNPNANTAGIYSPSPKLASLNLKSTIPESVCSLDLPTCMKLWLASVMGTSSPWPNELVNDHEGHHAAICPCEEAITCPLLQ
eukprot:1103088-Pelagomonas_calceolata.AAC.1